MSQVLREHAIVMLTAAMSTRAVSREFNGNFSTTNLIQRCFRECRRVGKGFADVNMVVVGLWCGQA